MSSLIDLLPLGEEVRCCTALAILLQSDPELLSGILAKVQPLFPGSKTTLPWSRPGWGKGIQELQVSVEENTSVRSEDRRLDLVVRFKLDGADCLVLVEAKVGAEGEHGGQIAAYESCLRDWNKKVDQVIGVLLTAAPLDRFEWQTKPEDLEHFRAHLSRKDVGEVIQGRIEDRDPKDVLFARLGRDLIKNLEDWIMGLKELQTRLSSPAARHCYPVLIDALEMLARQASGDERLNKEPRGVEGAPWDAKEDAYWCGYWWQVKGKWAALRLFWQYMRSPDEEPGKVTWIPEGETTGYAASVRLLIGSNEDQEGKEIQRWSLDEFGKELEHLPKCIEDLLSKASSQ